MLLVDCVQSGQHGLLLRSGTYHEHDESRIEIVLRDLRSRILRRMQDYGPRHNLTIQATRLSIMVQEKYNILNED